MQSWLGQLAACALCLSLACPGSAGPVSDFDDIEFWVGAGSQQAALVIDWGPPSTEPALAWGFRWEGTATGADMLTEIVSADDRLFAKLDRQLPNPLLVFGLGLDANQNGEFAIDDGTQFDAQGIAISPPAEGAQATDSGDLYGEGWASKFWHYAIADGNPFVEGSWSSSQFGFATRPLVEGDWNGWTFADPISFTAFPTDPHAAPPTQTSGDYNQDRRVSAADYTIWRNTLGQPATPPESGADGNGNGIVDADDYQIWKQHFAPAGGGSPLGQTVPEPGALVGAAQLLVLTALQARRARHRVLSPSRNEQE